MRRPFIAFLSLAAVLAISFLLFGSLGGSASASHAGGMDAMSIDMDPDATPANTGSALGSREPGGRIDENNVLDFDEDATDRLDFDITAEGIPASNPLGAFAADLRYGSPPSPDLCIVNAQYNSFMISTPVVTADVTPSCDGSFLVGAYELDLVFASGDGVLVRLTVQTEPGVQPGVYPLTLDTGSFYPIHIDDQANAYEVDSVNNAFICINTSCDDFDGDGVPNVDDLCPGTPPAEPVDVNGCSQSQVDGDLDGLCDPGASSSFCTGEDACPGIYGTPENDGCPPPGPPAVGGIAGLLDASDAPPPSEGGTSTAAYPWVALAAALPVLAAGGWLTMRLVLQVRRRIP